MLRLIVFCFVVGLAGCAYVTATPVARDSDASGIRIYGVKPLLVVAGAEVSLITIPNTSEQYAVNFGSFLSKHDFEAEFSNGFLNKVTSNQDSTALTIKLLESLTEASKAGVGIFDGFSESGGSLAASELQIYDIVFDDGGNLVQLRPLITKSGLTPVAAAALNQMRQAPTGGAPDSVDLN